MYSKEFLISGKAMAVVSLAQARNMKNAIRPQNVAVTALAVWLVCEPLPHTTALANLAALLMLIGLLLHFESAMPAIQWKSLPILAVGLFIGSLIITSLTGQDPLESLSTLRQGLLPELLAFMILISVNIPFHTFKRILIAVCAAFSLRALDIIVEVLILNRPDAYLRHGFALDSSLYMSLTFCLILIEKNKTTKFWLIASMAPQALALLTYGSRTPILGIALAMLIGILLSKSWTILTRSVICFLVAFIVLAGTSPSLVARYLTPFSSNTYSEDAAMLDRWAIWAGTFSVIRHRPLLGYGYGWKNLGKVAKFYGLDQEQSFPKKELAAIGARFFALPSEKVNPHSLVLQILFEAGILGLCAYIFFLFSIAIGANRALKERFEDERAMFVAFAGTMVLTSYLVVNVTNGLTAKLGILFCFQGLIYQIFQDRAQTRIGLKQARSDK
ncbi:MAG: O-antigen ligase family protein [Burkholderiales bacterium]